MDNPTNVVLKVLILSLGISVLLKFAGPSLPVDATSLNALIAVITPTLIVAIALLWRASQYQPLD